MQKAQSHKISEPYPKKEKNRNVLNGVIKNKNFLNF